MRLTVCWRAFRRLILLACLTGLPACSSGFQSAAKPPPPALSGASFTNGVFLLTGTNLDQVTAVMASQSGATIASSIVAKSFGSISLAPIAGAMLAKRLPFSLLLSSPAGALSSTLTVDLSSTTVTNFTSTGITDGAASTLLTLTSSGTIGIGTASPQAGLDVATTGTTGSAILIPRDTTTNRPSSPVNGMLRYNSTTGSFEGYQSGTWTNLAAFPASATLWLDEAATVAGTIAYVTDSGQRFGGYINNTSAANGDSIQQHFYLAAGTYTLYVLGATFTNRGLIDWYIDGSIAVSGQDWYTAFLVYDAILSASITVSTSGDHVLKAVVNGKNAASSGFDFVFTKAWIH